MNRLAQIAAVTLAATTLASCGSELPVFVTHTKKEDGYRQLVCTQLQCRHKQWMKKEGLGFYAEKKDHDHDQEQEASANRGSEHIMTALQVSSETPAVDLSPKPAMAAAFADAVDISAAKVVATNLEFGFDETELSPSAQQRLSEVAALLAENPSYVLGIVGHTDNVGDPEYNLALAQQRAHAVANYLAKQDVDEDQLIVIAHGMGYPMVSNRSEQGRAHNRRVELVVNP